MEITQDHRFNIVLSTHKVSCYVDQLAIKVLNEHNHSLFLRRYLDETLSNVWRHCPFPVHSIEASLLLGRAMGNKTECRMEALHWYQTIVQHQLDSG